MSDMKSSRRGFFGLIAAAVAARKLPAADAATCGALANAGLGRAWLDRMD